MQQIFIECFLRARHYAKHWELKKKKKKDTVPAVCTYSSCYRSVSVYISGRD